MKPKFIRNHSTFLRFAMPLCVAVSLSSVASATDYWWDNNGASAGFGTAGGTWGTSTFWNTSNTGTGSPTETSPTISDDLNFGQTTTGLAAGTIAITGTVNAQTLTFASASGAITLSGGTALNLAAASTITVNNASDTISTAITGAGTSLTKAGAGSLTLSGTNTFTGGVNLSAGTLILDNDAALGTGTLTLGTATTLNVTAARTTTNNNAQIWTGGTDTLLTYNSSNSLDFGTGAVTMTGAVTWQVKGSSLNIGGSIGDGGSHYTLAQYGGGTLILSGANTYTGMTSVVGTSYLRLNNTTALAGGIGKTGGLSNLRLSGGVVELTSASGDLLRSLGTGGSQVQLAGVSGFSAYGAARTVRFNDTASELTWGSTGFIQTTLILNDAVANAKLTFDHSIDLNGGARIISVGANTAEITGNIRNTSGAADSLIKTGGGTLVIDGTTSVGKGSTSALSVGADAVGGTLDVSANTLTTNVGNLYVGVSAASTTSTGTLKLGDANITATNFTIGGAADDGNRGASNKGTVTVASGKTVSILTPIMAIGTAKSSGGGLFQVSSSGGDTVTLGSTGARTQLTIARQTGTTTGSTITGSMDLSNTNATNVGELYLSKLLVGYDTGATTSGASTMTGSLILSSSASNHLDVSSAGNAVQIGYYAGSDASKVTGTVTIGNLDATSSVTSTDNSTAILIGQRSSGSQAVSGTLNLNGGTLTINTTGSAIAGGSGGTSKLNLGGASTNATLIAGASSSNWITGIGTATLNAGGATIDTHGFNIGMDQSFSGTGDLTKSGDGTLTFASGTTHAYTGNTNVNKGTLVVNGNISTSLLTEVASGATISGSGTTGALKVDSGAFQGISGSTSILNTGAYTLAGTLNAEINGVTPGTQHEQVNVTGAVDITGGTLASAFTGSYSNGDKIFLLLNDGTDAITGTFKNAVGGGNLAQGAIFATYGGFNWAISYNADSAANTFTGTLNGNDIALMAVPEQSAAILGGLGMLILLRRRRSA